MGRMHTRIRTPTADNSGINVDVTQRSRNGTCNTLAGLCLILLDLEADKSASIITQDNFNTHECLVHSTNALLIDDVGYEKCDQKDNQRRDLRIPRGDQGRESKIQRNGCKHL